MTLGKKTIEKANLSGLKKLTGGRSWNFELRNEKSVKIVSQ